MVASWQGLGRWLKEAGASCAFLNSTDNVYYLSGFYCQPHERLLGLLVFPDQEPVLICPLMEVPRAKAGGWSNEVLGYSDTDDPWELIRQNIGHRLGDAPVIAVEKDSLSLERAEALAKVFPGADLVSVESELQQLRNIKTPEEIGYLQKAAQLADKAIEFGVAALAAGKTELEIVAEIEYQLKKLGVSKMAFGTTVLFGAKTAEPHGAPGEAQLHPGDLVLIDLGVVFNGYCSDITRTFAFKAISPELEHIYGLTLEANMASLAACRPGQSIGAVDTAARELITAAGYGPNFNHRVGHGLGLNVHEYPSMHEDNTGLLQQGMAFTIEPGIYLPGIGGVRIEDDVVITAEGCSILTKFPKHLQIVK